ncbi:MAG: hypothetical protein ABIP97_13575, partial [Chthoniobacterales bacterium]
WFRENGQSGYFLMYRTEGRVFQAEEVMVGGKWQRFFGYVGQFHIAKVPASEIEFPSEMSLLSHGFEGDLTAPDKWFQRGFYRARKLKWDAPLPFNLKVRNRSGLDQTVSGALLQPDFNTGKLPHAVELKMEYSDKSITEEYCIPESSWQSVPLKTEVQVADAQASGLILQPTEEYVIMTDDLRRFFDVSRHGNYRLQAIFNDPNGVTGSTIDYGFIIGEKSAY